MSDQDEVKDRGKQVYVPVELYEQIMMRKESSGQTISFQVSQAIREWLDRMNSK